MGIVNDLNLNALLDTFSDLVATKLSRRLTESGQEAGKMRKRLLTVEEAAIYLGRPKEAVQHLIAAGKLKTVKPDRRVFLDIRDLDDWIEQNKLQ